MAVSDNLVYETATTTGTSDFTLAGAVNGFQSFNGAFGTGGSDVFFYFISHISAAEWEVGTGHLSASTTLVRDTVIDSSNSGSAVNFSAGTKNVTSDVPSGRRINDVNIQVFTSSGTYTPTSGMRYCIVECLGAGGGGGGSSNTNLRSGGGGGAGGYGVALFTASDIGSSQTVTIGAGGGGGTTTGSGSTGGTSSVGSLISCTGGGGGGAATVGGTGGTSTGGDFNVGGGDGLSGGTLGFAALGLGASSLYGFGGVTQNNGGGKAAQGYGAGGGGGTNSSSTAKVGGDGSAGVVIIVEYY